MSFVLLLYKPAYVLIKGPSACKIGLHRLTASKPTIILHRFVYFRMLFFSTTNLRVNPIDGPPTMSCIISPSRISSPALNG